MKASKLLRVWGTALGLAGAGLLLGGCKSGGEFTEFVDPSGATLAGPGSQPGATGPGTQATGLASSTPLANLESSGRDELHINDVVMITFTDVPTLMMPIDQRIRDDGKVLLLQNQTFVFAGKKIGDLEQEIRAAYVPKYFKTMTVSVQKKPDTQFYFVGGEVKASGRQVYITSITVLGAIKSAGDFTDFARKTKIQLRRANGHILYVNGKAALKDPKLDLEVYPGDNVTVPRKSPWSL
jgi:polysaccharide export outer membrane protein